MRFEDGLTLDTGALIALERGDREMSAILTRARVRDVKLTVPSGVIAQAWRGGPRQVRIAKLLTGPDIETPALDEHSARAVGALCGISGTSDVVDAHVALVARQRDYAVVTSDPDGIRAIDPSLRIIAI